MSRQICKKYEETLILAASGVADAATLNSLRGHLEECEACRTELDRLRRILSFIEDDSAAGGMACRQGLHAGLMKRLRAEPQKEAERPSGMSWARMLSWLRLSVTARVLLAIGAVGIVMLLIVRWAGEGGRNNSGSLATKAENQPAELDLFAGEPAGPAELRRSLVHSLEDFEVVLRRNDRASARRDPVAVPANARPVEGL